MTGQLYDGDDPALPAGPLFPEGVGEVLHDLLHPKFSSGPPWTHTFSYPPTEYDDDGEPLPQPWWPSITLLPRGVSKAAYAQAWAADNAESALLRIVHAEIHDAVARDVRCVLLKTPPHRLTNSPNIDRLLR